MISKRFDEDVFGHIQPLKSVVEAPLKIRQRFQIQLTVESDALGMEGGGIEVITGHILMLQVGFEGGHES